MTADCFWNKHHAIVHIPDDIHHMFVIVPKPLKRVNPGLFFNHNCNGTNDWGDLVANTGTSDLAETFTNDGKYSCGKTEINDLADISKANAARRSFCFGNLSLTKSQLGLCLSKVNGEVCVGQRLFAKTLMVLCDAKFDGRGDPVLWDGGKESNQIIIVEVDRLVVLTLIIKEFVNAGPRLVHVQISKGLREDCLGYFK